MNFRDWARAGERVSEYSSERSTGATRVQRTRRSSPCAAALISASASLLPGHTRLPTEYGMNLHLQVNKRAVRGGLVVCERRVGSG